MDLDRGATAARRTRSGPRRGRGSSANLAAWRAERGGEPASGDTREGFAQHLDWERRLFADRWAVGVVAGGATAAATRRCGSGCSSRRSTTGPAARSGSRRTASSCSRRRVFEFGTPEQQDRILPRMAAAEDLWCQGWSEPNAGSDLAGVTSRARRVDGGWVLDGQKTWTTRGAFCTHLFGLFRTDPEQRAPQGPHLPARPARHRRASPCAGFGRLDGDEGFAEVFFDDAFLADDAVPGGVVLGEADGGWAVAMATTGSERGLTLRSPGRFLATADAAARRSYAHDARRRRACGSGSPTRGCGPRPTSCSTLADRHAAERRRRQAGAEASLNKLWWSELDVELHEIALDLLGPEAELEGPWSEGLAVRAVRARSTPAPTRSSATSPPSASWGSRDER